MNYFHTDPVMLNIPIIIEKEAAMQIDDNLPLINISDAVSVATYKLNLAHSILFQSKVLSIIESLKKHKNVIKRLFLKNFNFF